MTKKCPKCGKPTKGKMMDYIEDDEGREKHKPYWVPGRMKVFSWDSAGDDDYYPDEEILVWETENGKVWLGWYDNMNDAVFQTTEIYKKFEEVSVSDVREYCREMYNRLDLSTSMKIDQILETSPDEELLNSPEEIVEAEFSPLEFLRNPEEEEATMKRCHEKLERTMKDLELIPKTKEDEKTLWVDEQKPKNLKKLK